MRDPLHTTWDQALPPLAVIIMLGIIPPPGTHHHAGDHSLALTSRARHSVRVAGFVALPTTQNRRTKVSLIVFRLPSESRLHLRSQSCASMGVLLWMGGEWWLIRGRRFE